MSSAAYSLAPAEAGSRYAQRLRAVLTAAAWIAAALLPLVGLLSLLLREQLDFGWTNHRVHFTVFLAVGVALFVLAYAAGAAANRRGDARVLLISLAFLSTGGFLGLHALGTHGVLFTHEYEGFKIANPVGLIIASVFALASAFVDLRPSLAPLVMRRRVALRRAVLGAMALWFLWTVSELPPLHQPAGEAAGSRGALAALAGVGAVAYAVAAARYWSVYRGRISLLPASVIACFVLLAQAMVGVALTGERRWHASWWEWHGLIVVAYAIVSYAAHRQWHEERFRGLYLETTRERAQSVSVLFSDLAGFTRFSERTGPAEVARVLERYYGVAAPLVRRFGGEVEKFIGDGMMATFNSRGDTPDHAVRAAGAALALQRELTAIADAHPGWPRLRVGVNSGAAVVRELGGEGFVAYVVVGDTVNTASRLESMAPEGGVLVGAETHAALPAGTVAEAMPSLQVKGKREAVDAYLLRSLPAA